jgi:hypothetical protein
MLDEKHWHKSRVVPFAMLKTLCDEAVGPCTRVVGHDSMVHPAVPSVLHGVTISAATELMVRSKQQLIPPAVCDAISVATEFMVRSKQQLIPPVVCDVISAVAEFMVR